MAARRAPSQEFTVSQVLSNGFSIWWENVLPFFVLAFLIQLPLLAYTVWVLTAGFDVADLGNLWLFVAVPIALGLLLGPLVNAALIYGVFEQLRGNKPDMGQCISVGLSRLFPAIGVGLIVGLGFIFGCSCFVLPGLLIAAAWWVAVAVVVVERPGVIESLRRSWTLTEGHRWQIVGIIVIVYAIGQGAQMIVNMLDTLTSEGLNVFTFVSFVVAALVAALQATMAGVGYYELRRVKEGVGIDELVSVFA